VAPGRPARPLRRTVGQAGWYLLLSTLSVLVLFPVYMTLVRALSNPREYLLEGLPLFPVAVEWDVFSRAWDLGDLGGRMLLSLVVTTIIVAAQLATSVLAAYAFAFLRFPLKRVLFLACMATLMLPIEVTLLVNLSTMRELGWMNSLQGLTAPFLATAFGIFLIRQGFLGIPRDLRDAAALDGFGHLAFLRRVAIPVTRPVIASFVVISFLSAWNQYTWPRTVTDESRWATLQIALKQIATVNIEELNIAFAAAIIAALPVLALLVLLQRQLIRGLTAGAVKG
jgi:sn-glycerol 3-phosphate transport system permease protein